MQIYLAGFFDTRHRLHAVRAQLEAVGHTVKASWLDEDADWEGKDPVMLARRDLREVREADLILVDTLDPSPRGGRETELGYALGSGIPAMTVGPRRTIFHHLVWNFPTWDEALLLLKVATATARALRP